MIRDCAWLGNLSKPKGVSVYQSSHVAPSTPLEFDGPNGTLSADDCTYITETHVRLISVVGGK